MPAGGPRGAGLDIGPAVGACPLLCLVTFEVKTEVFAREGLHFQDDGKHSLEWLELHDGCVSYK